MALRRFLPAAILLAFVSAGSAQEGTVERQAKGQAGRDIRIAIFGSLKPDCTPGQLPTVKLKQPPANGTVTVKQTRIRATNIKQCLAVEVPAFVAFYRSAPGFTGQDSVVIEVVSPGGKTQLHRYTVTVEKPASAGQNI